MQGLAWNDQRNRTEEHLVDTQFEASNCKFIRLAILGLRDQPQLSI